MKFRSSLLVASIVAAGTVNAATGSVDVSVSGAIEAFPQNACKVDSPESAISFTLTAGQTDGADNDFYQGVDGFATKENAFSISNCGTSTVFMSFGAVAPADGDTAAVMTVDADTLITLTATDGEGNAKVGPFDSTEIEATFGAKVFEGSSPDAKTVVVGNPFEAEVGFADNAIIDLTASISGADTAEFLNEDEGGMLSGTGTINVLISGEADSRDVDERPSADDEDKDRDSEGSQFPVDSGMSNV